MRAPQRRNHRLHEALSQRWGEAISAANGNYAMAERSARRHKATVGESVGHVGGEPGPGNQYVTAAGSLASPG